MLDQNTDRMWYVIGAVIVGAAIVLILNSTAPELFASVADTFKEKTDETISEVDGIAPYRRTDGINLLKNGDKVHNSGYEFLQIEDLTPIIETYGLEQTYTLSFDVRSKDTSNENEMRVYMQSGSGTKYGFVHKVMTVTEEYESVVIRGLSPSNNPVDSPGEVYYETSMLAFYGTYGTGNNPIVTNVRLEREI